MIFQPTSAGNLSFILSNHKEENIKFYRVIDGLNYPNFNPDVGINAVTHNAENDHVNVTV